MSSWNHVHGSYAMATAEVQLPMQSDAHLWHRPRAGPSLAAAYQHTEHSLETPCTRCTWVLCSPAEAGPLAAGA